MYAVSTHKYAHVLRHRRQKTCPCCAWQRGQCPQQPDAPESIVCVCVCVFCVERTETRRGTKRNERNRKQYAQTQSACCAWTGEACAHGRARIPVPTRDEWCGVCSPAYHPCCPTRPAARSCTGIPPAPSPGWCRRPPSRCRASWRQRREPVRAGAGWGAGLGAGLREHSTGAASRTCRAWSPRERRLRRLRSQ